MGWPWFMTCLIALCLVIDIVVLWIFPDRFERLAAVWLAAAIVLFTHYKKIADRVDAGIITAQINNTASELRNEINGSLVNLLASTSDLFRRTRRLENLPGELDPAQEAIERLRADLGKEFHSNKQHLASIAKSKREMAPFRSSIVYGELTCLVVFTLQWSFGDLLANRLVICGEWQCSY